ncbi:MAG TPA: hypothetical protein VFA26_13540 [Gemmataceae bacterium]|nr:hypothetical protein [Gemmataceae bacterium]
MSGGYTVIWRRRLIEHDLAGYVVSAMQQGDDVAAITPAMNEIDRLLATDPHAPGESRDEFERVLIVPPLVVGCEIHEDEHVVYVLRARHLPGRPSEN